ncbi:MAG: aminotransferase class I/II-fold pyridoxal phosphate-dependent enzyme [Mucilaginibacter sp.]|nr:aminotransferase class I/II-fold pyridoxal phosphate-dependent enzyme [Mucilaginibacter sp.]
MQDIKRRNFLRLSALGLLPMALPLSAAKAPEKPRFLPITSNTVSFDDDGPFYEPEAYLSKLQEINKADPIKNDFYGKGGSVARLQEKFMQETGKEAAIYLPSGTMANQLAIAVLSGENTKVFVQETSHIYRDEADAAQSVFHKRLIPLAPGAPFFTLEELQEGMNYYNQGEVFKSGIGAVAIENPVRRCDGRQLPFAELQKISAFCRQNGYPMHLDGARLYLAAAWSGISIAAFAALFDTVYISLYKYWGANGGAMLCGSKNIISQMEHLIKVHGGTAFSCWTNAAMALHHLEGLTERLKLSADKANTLFTSLNELPGLSVKAIANGSNIFDLHLPQGIDPAKFRKAMATADQIQIGRANKENLVKLRINETLLLQDNQKIIRAFSSALKAAKT